MLELEPEVGQEEEEEEEEVRSVLFHSKIVLYLQIEDGEASRRLACVDLNWDIISVGFMNSDG